MKRWRIAFVVPRYEIGMAGGAEVHAAQLAEKLAKRGHEIEVFTTCAQDHHEWKNVYQEGTRKEKGVLVHRFLADSKKDQPLFLLLQKKIHIGLKLSHEEEQTWISDSVHSQALYQNIAARQKDFDGIIFMPYLFGMAYEGSKYVDDKFILIPCLHDEPYAYLHLFNDMFHRAKHIFFNTQPEKDLAEKIYHLNPSKSHLVALGFEPGSKANPEDFRAKHNLNGTPFILFAGRRETGKNIPQLLEYFKCYVDHVQSNLKLVLVGSGEVNIPKDYSHRILDLGFVSSEDKRNAVAASLAFCLPSINESLSIVIMEAWSLKVPVLVHSDCAVTRNHCVRSGGGLYFSSYYEFEEELELLRNQSALRQKMGSLGHDYVRREYSWEAVIDRFERAFEIYMSV